MAANVLSAMGEAQEPERMDAIRVSVFDQDKARRESLAVVLRGTDGFVCVGVHHNPRELRRSRHCEAPNVVLLAAEPSDGIAASWTAQLKILYSQAKILAVLPSGDERLIFNLLEAGASGFLVRPVGLSTILEAIAEVHRVGISLCPQAARLMFRERQQHRLTQRALATLTERELEILNGLAKGWLSKQIAGSCSLSVETVKTHLRHIYHKLGVHSRAGALAKYLRG